MIKINFIFLLSWVLIYNLNGQSYYKLLEPNKSWDVTWTICGYAPCSWNTTTYKVLGDSLINYQTYYKIYDKLSHEDSYSLNPTLLREDVDSMKVYKYNSYKKQEFLLYDFSIGESDSIIVFGRGSNVLLVVDSISEIIIDEKVRRVIFFKNNQYPKGFWIEGIGSNHGLLFPDFNYGMVDAGNELNCVHINDSLIYMNPRAVSCIQSNVNVEKIVKEYVRVQYNPIRFTFTSGYQNAILKIYNVNGVLIEAFYLDGENEIILDPDYYTPGIYLFNCYQNQLIWRGKFVIPNY